MPAFFERLVVRLLVAMGYGGQKADAAKVVGQAGDGGTDGIIKAWIREYLRSGKNAGKAVLQ